MKPQKLITFSSPNAPLSIKWLNKLARITKPTFDGIVSLQKENLLETAKRRTGLQDWGDARFEDRLSAILDAVINEGNLTFFGRFTIRQFLIENLCTRLRVIEVFKRFPKIRAQKIQQPIFITGWYRSGTTYLHNLLATHPDARVPLFWELRCPCPTLDPRTADPRRQIRKVRMESRFHRWLAPDFNDIHPMAPEKAEECLHLFENACAGTTAFVITEAKSFAWQLLQQGMEQGYEFYKIQLQLLNWLRPGRRWVLKWPYHLWHLDTLLKNFPDASIIQLHRNPHEAIPSVCSLSMAARAPFCEYIDTEALGKFWLNYYETGLQRSKKARDSAGNDQIIDIRYPDLMQDPRSAMKEIQHKAKLNESETWLQSLQENSKIIPRKRHHYTMDRYGLSADEIREWFAEYIEDYDFSNQRPPAELGV
jgi:hypothetical protein